ncbi:MAG: hypothetical protein GEU74_15925 [Nitriliruptorales bacterium]|nr:hypothetical protein [Nitriliruptorales bacterium]
MNNPGTNPRDDTITQQVSDTLRSAFAAIATADIAPDEKGRWQQRLIAVTNIAKRDVSRAHEQLVRFNDEWNTRLRGKDEPEDETGR